MKQDLNLLEQTERVLHIHSDVTVHRESMMRLIMMLCQINTHIEKINHDLYLIPYIKSNCK